MTFGATQKQAKGFAALQGAFHPKTVSDVLVTERFTRARVDVPATWMAFHQESISSLKKIGIREPAVVTTINTYIEGLLSEAAGKDDAALDFYLKAVDGLEADRRALRDDRARGTVLEGRMDYYHSAVRLLLVHKRYADAFQMFERARSRALSDLLATRQPGLARPLEQKLFAESAVLRTQIADAQGQAARAHQSGRYRGRRDTNRSIGNRDSNARISA